MDFERLQELVRQSGKTQQEIADECGLSLATVKKVLHGQTSNPGVDTLIRILNTIGKSLRDIDSDFAGVPQGYSKEDLYEELIATNKERISNLVAEGRRKNIQLSLLSGVSVLLMVVLSGIFIVDSRYPSMGLIRPETKHLLTIAGGTMLVFALFAGYLIYISIKDWKKLK